MEPYNTHTGFRRVYGGLSLGQRLRVKMSGFRGYQAITQAACTFTGLQRFPGSCGGFPTTCVALPMLFPSLASLSLAFLQFAQRPERALSRGFL